MVPPGFRFRPTDEELISLYLLKKVRGEDLPWDGIHECDLYGEKAPEQIFDDLDGEEKHYLFTKLKKIRRRVVRSTGCGTWHESAGRQIYDKYGQQVIGFNKQFSFKAKQGTCFKKSNWIMHEFSLAGASLVGEQERSSDWVLCTVNKKQSGSKRMMDQNMSSSVQVPKAVTSTNELLLHGDGFQDRKRMRCSDQSNVLQADGMQLSCSSEFTPSASSAYSEEDVEPEHIPPLTDLETHIDCLPSYDNLGSFESELPLPQNFVENYSAAADSAGPEGCLPSDDNADSQFHALCEHFPPSSSPESANLPLDSLWMNLNDDEFFDTMLVWTESC